MLLHLIGDEGITVFNTFQFEGTGKENFDTVIEQFDAYCKVKTNVVYERHRFFKTIRAGGQSLENYLTTLKTIALGCEFGEQTSNLIRDQIVLHLDDSTLQERILRESDITLGKVIEFIKTSEAVKEQVKSIQYDDIEGIHVYFDDILVAADDDEEHDKIMNKVMNRARESLKWTPMEYEKELPCAECSSIHSYYSD